MCNRLKEEHFNVRFFYLPYYCCTFWKGEGSETKWIFTAQKMKFSIKDFSSKCEKSHLLEKSLMENFIFLCRHCCCIWIQRSLHLKRFNLSIIYKIFAFGNSFFRISVFFVELQLRFFQRLYQRVIHEKYMYNIWKI